MIESEIYKAIKDNEDTIAFIVGNGINRYCNRSESVSWECLLQDLWIKYANGNKSNFPSNMPYTEIYDIIELQYYKNHTKPNIELGNNSLNKLVSTYKHNPNLMEPILSLHNHCSIDRNNLPHISATKEMEKARKELNNAVLQILSVTKEMEKARKELDNAVLKILNEFGFPKDSPSLDDFQFALDLRCGGESRIRLWIKHVISHRFKNVTLNDKSLPFLTYAKKIKAPILTTNYDCAMANKLGLIKFQLPFDIESQHIYPLSTYFGEKELEKSTDDFGIWHINGIAEYQNSIRLGLCDYMDLVQYIRNLLRKDEQLNLLNSNAFVRNRVFTWVDILFKKSLIVFGLGLDKDEIPLRWLLLLRYKYSLYFKQNLKGWYVAPKEDLNESKRLFLENVGIKVISVDDYKTIYEDIWEQLKGESI